MICLDTTFIIDFLKNNPRAINACNNLKDEILATTTVNVFEILFGILRKKQINQTKEIEGFMNFINNVDVLSLDYKSSVRASELASDLVRKGLQIESNDCLIAGIMLANNCNTLISLDKEHFERIKGIKVESY